MVMVPMIGAGAAEDPVAGVVIVAVPLYTDFPKSL